MTTSTVVPLFADESQLDAAWTRLDRAIRAHSPDYRPALEAYSRVIARLPATRFS
jgi:hypothetical protein